MTADPEPSRPTQIAAKTSAFLFLVLAATGVGHAVFGVAWLKWTGVVCTVVFLILEIRAVPRFQAVMAVLMIGIGLGISGNLEDIPAVLIAGLVKAQVFLVVFFAVAWLQIPAAASPALAAVRRAVVAQPPGRRFFYLAGSGHVLGSVLNLAGLVLLSTMVDRQTDRHLQRRMATALMHGYVAASIWSPFYVSVVVVLIALPSLDWSDAVFHGLPLAAVTVGCAWAFDRIFYRRRGGPDTGAATTPRQSRSLQPRQRRNLTLVLGSLAVSVIGMVELTGWSLPVVLALVAPLFGMIWMTLIAGPAAPAHKSGWQLTRTVFERLPGLRNEALAFVAASIFGIAVAEAVPAETFAAIAGSDWTIAALVFGVVGLGFCGLHPVIPVIFVGEVLPPDVIGLPAEIIGMALLGSWGLSTLVSPFSGTTLIMSRFVPAPSHVIAWRWNAPYSLVATTAVSLSIIAVWRMQFF